MRARIVPAVSLIALAAALLTGCGPAQDQGCPLTSESLADIVGAPVAEAVVADSTEYPEYAPYGSGDVTQLSCEVRFDVPDDGERFHVHQVILRSVDAGEGAAIADAFFATTGDGLSTVDSWSVAPASPAGWGERAWIGVTGSGQGRAEFEAEGRFWSLYVNLWDDSPAEGAVDAEGLVGLVGPVTEAIGAAIVTPF